MVLVLKSENIFKVFKEEIATAHLVTIMKILFFTWGWGVWSCSGYTGQCELTYGIHWFEVCCCLG